MPNRTWVVAERKHWNYERSEEVKAGITLNGQFILQCQGPRLWNDKNTCHQPASSILVRNPLTELTGTHSKNN